MDGDIGIAAPPRSNIILYLSTLILVGILTGSSLCCRLPKNFVLIFIRKQRACFVDVHIDPVCLDNHPTHKQTMLKQESSNGDRQPPQFGDVLFLDALLNFIFHIQSSSLLFYDLAV